MTRYARERLFGLLKKIEVYLMIFLIEAFIIAPKPSSLVKKPKTNIRDVNGLVGKISLYQRNEKHFGLQLLIEL